MEQRIIALRGAIQVADDSPQSIQKSVGRLFDALCEKNETMVEDSMVCIMFTITDDLHSMNPATALRRDNPSLQAPLFCMQEPGIVGMLPRMIRMLIQFYAPDRTFAHPVYLDGAEKLRPDLSSH